jgi:hypothetical protein
LRREGYIGNSIKERGLSLETIMHLQETLEKHKKEKNIKGDFFPGRKMGSN